MNGTGQSGGTNSGTSTGSGDTGTLRAPRRRPTPPKTYKVARSTRENEVLNTIDLFEDFPFSV